MRTHPTRGEPTALGPVAALAALSAPAGAERFSPLTGAAWLVVDLASGPMPTSRQRAALAEALGRLAAPSIAIAPPALDAGRRAGAAAFDVVLERADALAPLAEAIAARPLAAAALVTLLRGSEERGLEEGLRAESQVYSTLQGGPEFAEWLAARGAPAPRAADEGAPLRVERQGSRLDLTLDRPHVRNAFSAALRDALCEALELALCDDAIDEVWLRGAGPAFCSGGDLDEFGTLPDPATAHVIRLTRNAGRLLARCGARAHAEVHGACIGAGVELPAFTPRVVAREDAFFALPELAMGLVPGAGGTVSLPRRIGRQRTAWLALSGERIDAATALSWGLVDEVR